MNGLPTAGTHVFELITVVGSPTGLIDIGALPLPQGEPVPVIVPLELDWRHCVEPATAVSFSPLVVIPVVGSTLVEL